ncbi:MAG: hypothetical protein ACRC1K_13130 [Planctomycetia bacterium]
MNRASASIVFALLCSAGVAAAAKPQFVRHEAKELAAAALERVVVDSAGVARLAPALEIGRTVDSAHVWSSAVAADGTVYIGAGSPGRVLRIPPKGDAETLWKGDDSQVFAVAVDPAGVVYAGVSPSGQIVKITPGKPKPTTTAIKTDQTYIWRLAVGPAGKVYAATGGKNGKLLAIMPDDKIETVGEIRQPHLLSLAVSPAGEVYAGGSTDGWIVRFEKSKPVVLFDAPQPDVYCLTLGADGSLYAGTTTPTRASGETSSAPSVTPRDAAAAVGDKPLTLAAAVEPKPFAEPPATAAPTGATGPAAGENAVYRVRADGAVDELFRQKTMILSLAETDGVLFVGTGPEGRLYQVSPAQRTWSEVGRLEVGQILSMALDPRGGVLATTGAPGRLVRLTTKAAAAGSLTSEVVDAKLPARWGALQTVSTGAGLKKRMRVGNVAKPDDTWSDWTDADSPVGRYSQYRLDFSGDAAGGPQVRAAVVPFATLNQPPAVESIETPDLAKTPLAVPVTKIKMKWKASDPNGDVLSYTVEVKKADWPTWVAVAVGLTEPEFEWETAALPSGTYVARVAAVDAPSNTPAEAARHHRDSFPVLVDNEPPTASLDVQRKAAGPYQVSATAVDKVGPLVNAAYSLDGSPWTAVAAADGFFDQAEEKVAFTINSPPETARILLVRFQDAAGRFGVAEAVLLDKQ